MLKGDRPMNIENVIRLSLVCLSYIVLIFGLASIMLKRIIWVKGFSNKILLYFIAGNFYVINIVFLLLFFKCTSRVITIAVLLAGAIGIQYFLDRTLFKKTIDSRVKVFAYLSEGLYGWNFFRKERIEHLREKVKEYSIFLLKTRFLEMILFITCIVIHAYYVGYRLVDTSSFGMYDELVHLTWIQKMLQGQIFSDGVYPFGMHNVIYAVIKVFGIEALTVSRYFGFVIMMFSIVMLYFFLKTICRSKYTPLLGLFLYVASNLFVTLDVNTQPITLSIWNRMPYAIPDQFGMVFLYPVCIYLYQYIQSKERKDLIVFGISFTLTLYIHYYVTIIAMLLCLCIGLVRIDKIIKEKVLLKIIVCGLISIIIGILPIGIGIASGNELQGSLEWAISVITDAPDQNQENNESQITEKDKDLDSKYTLENIKINLLKIRNKTLNYLAYQQVFTIVTLCMLLIFVNTLMRIIFSKMKQETYLQFSVVIYVSILMILLSSEELGLPQLMEASRISVYLAYAIPLLLCMPLEMIYEIFELGKIPRIISETVVVLLLGLVIVFIMYSDNYKRQLNQYRMLQTDSSVEVVYDIIKKHKNYSWTIVSVVDEYSMILDIGWHYELLDFLREVDTATRVNFPTENIFFFIEKRPIHYGYWTVVGKEKDKPRNITKEDAKTPITGKHIDYPSKYYIEERCAIMAKAYYWAEKYKEYFPNEMKVYYEDDDFICYHLKQEPYYLNNLVIDYGYKMQVQE